MDGCSQLKSFTTRKKILTLKYMCSHCSRFVMRMQNPEQQGGRRRRLQTRHPLVRLASQV
jgi:hypothetical protein